MSRLISRQKLKWITSVAITLAVLVFILSGIFRNRASADAAAWEYAANNAPSGLMAQVLEDHLNPNLPVDSGRMKLWKVELAGQEQPLYLIDSRIANSADYPHANPLCGASGCAFFGYVPAEGKSFREVWNTYLNINLPPAAALFESPDELRNGLPVLKTNQMQGNRIEQSHWSYNGQNYEITNTLLTPQTYE